MLRSVCLAFAYVCRSFRGLYNKCVCDGDLQRDRTGYTDVEQKVPAAIFVVGLAIIALAGLLGLQGDRNVTSGLELMFTSERILKEALWTMLCYAAIPSSRHFTRTNQ